MEFTEGLESVGRVVVTVIGSISLTLDNDSLLSTF